VTADFRVERCGDDWSVYLWGPIADHSIALDLTRDEALEAVELFLAAGRRALQALLDLVEYPRPEVATCDECESTGTNCITRRRTT
jgi:hypothetical protein